MRSTWLGLPAVSDFEINKDCHVFDMMIYRSPIPGMRGDAGHPTNFILVSVHVENPATFLPSLEFK